MNHNYFSDFLFSYILQGFQSGKFALPEREICGKSAKITSDDTAFTSDDTGKSHVDNRSLTGIFRSPIHNGKGYGFALRVQQRFPPRLKVDFMPSLQS